MVEGFYVIGRAGRPPMGKNLGNASTADSRAVDWVNVKKLRIRPVKIGLGGGFGLSGVCG